MFEVSALLSLLQHHLDMFAVADRSVPPETAATVARLLSACQAEATDMEARLYSSEKVGSPPSNVIHIDFKPAAVSPTGPDVA